MLSSLSGPLYGFPKGFIWCASEYVFPFNWICSSHIWQTLLYKSFNSLANFVSRNILYVSTLNLPVLSLPKSSKSVSKATGVVENSLNPQIPLPRPLAEKNISLLWPYASESEEAVSISLLIIACQLVGRFDPLIFLLPHIFYYILQYRQDFLLQ